MSKANRAQFEWESGAQFALSMEHSRFTRSHKVRLRCPNIEFFNSETQWGRFDEATYTISISRILALTHPWHHVLGVFYHEIAHQYVAEHSQGRHHHEPPHGPLFQQACKLLGVPDHFARASVDVHGFALDWRTEKRDDDVTERMLEKVRKLLALAGSANEHEAFLAMERVRELHAKYNLEQQSADVGFVHATIETEKLKLAGWCRHILSILRDHFFVRTITSKEWSIQVGAYAVTIEIIGTRENVLMAEYVYHFLIYQVEQLVKQAKPKLLRNQRDSYRIGILAGFASKLKQSERAQATSHGNRVSANGEGARATEPNQAGEGRSLIAQALSQFKNDPRLEEYLSRIYPHLRSARSGSRMVDGHAYQAGQQAGKSITLHKPIHERSGNQGRLLSGGG